MIAPILEGSDRGARLKTQMVLPPHAKAALDNDDIPPSEGSIAIASDHRRLPGHIVAPRAALKQDLILAPSRMHERSLRRERLRHGNDGREVLIFHHDRGGGRLGDRERVSRDGGEGLTVIANAISREEQLVGDADAVETRSIISGDYGANARRREGVPQVKPHELCRRRRCATNCRVQHARTRAVYGVARAAAQLVASVTPRQVAGCAGWINHSAALSLWGRDARIAASMIRS